MAQTRHATDTSGTPTKSDNARHKREAAAGDRARQRAYDEGRQAGRTSKLHHRKPDPGDAMAHGDAADQYGQGYEAGRGERFETLREHVANKTETKIDMGDQISGFILALLAWAVFVNYATGGTAGVRAWLKAKFYNQPEGWLPPQPPRPPKQAPGSPSNPHGIPPGTQPAAVTPPGVPGVLV